MAPVATQPAALGGVETAVSAVSGGTVSSHAALSRPGGGSVRQGSAAAAGLAATRHAHQQPGGEGEDGGDAESSRAHAGSSRGGGLPVMAADDA